MNNCFKAPHSINISGQLFGFFNARKIPDQNFLSTRYLNQRLPCPIGIASMKDNIMTLICQELCSHTNQPIG